MLCTLQKLSMASAGEQPPQTNNVDASTQKDEEDLLDVCAVFFSGMRVMAGAYLLDRLRLALSIHLVNVYAGVDGEFYNALYAQLAKIEQFKGRIENKTASGKVENYLLDILESLNLLQQKRPKKQHENFRMIDGIRTNGGDISKEIKELRTMKKKTENTFVMQGQKTEVKDKTWCIQESPLLKEAMEHISSNVKIENLQSDLEGDQFKDFSQRMKVAVVHGLLTSWNVAWTLFINIEKTGFLLLKDWKHFQGKTACDLLDYIRDERNRVGHTAQLEAGKEIETFVDQFDKIDEFLDRYFGNVDPKMPPEEKREHLKYLFSDIPDYMTTNKLTNAYTNFKAKLIDRVPELVSENELLELTVSLLEMEKKQLAYDVWSTVEEYYKKHKPTLSTDDFYKKLLGLVRNPNEIESGYDQLVRDLRQAHRLPPRAMQLSGPAKDVTPQMQEGPVNTTTADESSQAEGPVDGDFDGQRQDAVEVDCWP